MNCYIQIVLPCKFLLFYIVHIFLKHFSSAENICVLSHT